MRSLWRRLRRSLPGRVLSRYLSRRGPNQATLIAWNLLFAVFPIVILAATLAGTIFQDPSVGRAVSSEVAALLPNGRREVVLQALAAFHRDRGWLAAVGIVGLLWSGSSLFGAMDQAFADLSGSTARGFVAQKLMSVAMIVLLTVLAGPVVLSSSMLAGRGQLPHLPSWLYGGPVAPVLQFLLSVLVGTVLFGAIYGLVPRHRQQLGAILWGALAAGTCLEGLSLLFPLYFHLEHGFSSYGSTFGLFFLILAYVFLVSQIVVLGYLVAVESDPASRGAGETPAAAVSLDREPGPAPS